MSRSKCKVRESWKEGVRSRQAASGCTESWCPSVESKRSSEGRAGSTDDGFSAILQLDGVVGCITLDMSLYCVLAGGCRLL